MHKNSSLVDIRSIDLTRSLHTPIHKFELNSLKKVVPSSKNNKSHSSRAPLLHSTLSPPASGKKSSKTKSALSLSNGFANESKSKPASRRSLSQKLDINLLAESLQKLQYQRMPASNSQYLSRREQEFPESLVSSQKATPLHRNNSTASLMADFYSQATKDNSQGKDHRRGLETNFKNMGMQQSQSQAQTPHSKISKAGIISNFVDVVHDSKKAGRFANNHALQSVFNKVSKYINKPKQAVIPNNSSNIFYKPQHSNHQINAADYYNALSRKSSMQTLDIDRSGTKKHLLPSFNGVAYEFDGSAPLTHKNNDVEIIHSFSRRSSQGMASRGMKSNVESKESSPKIHSHRKAMPFKFNDPNETPVSAVNNQKIMKLLEPSVQFKLNEVPINKEKKSRKNAPYSNQQDQDLDSDSIKIYQNFQDGASTPKNSNAKLFNSAVASNLKSSMNNDSRANSFQFEKSVSGLYNSIAKEAKGIYLPLIITFLSSPSRFASR